MIACRHFLFPSGFSIGPLECTTPIPLAIQYLDSFKTSHSIQNFVALTMIEQQHVYEQRCILNLIQYKFLILIV